MKDIQNEIPDSSYSSELKKIILRHPARQNQDLHFLYELVNCELTDASLKTIADKEVSFLTNIQNLNYIKNSEIIARWKDMLFQINYTDKISHIQDAIEKYLEVYNGTKDPEYLIRVIILVRKIKSKYADKLEELCEFTIQEIKNQNSSYKQHLIIKAYSCLNHQKYESDLITFFKNQLELSLLKKNYFDAKNHIETLHDLKQYSIEEYKIQTALCIETEADDYSSQKAENTYYPNILHLYTNSLRTLKGIKVPSEIKQRIEKKIKKEQLTYNEMLRKIGISLDSDTDMRKYVEELHVDDFASGYNNLLSIPILDAKQLESENSSKKLFSQFFKEYVQISPKGTVTGITDEAAYNTNLTRTYCRNYIILLLREIKLIMDLDHTVSKEEIYNLIEKADSRFIPVGREHLFIEGIYHGFNNNFILASHILMPQIENSLKYIVEQNGRNTIRLADDIQNDNTLGGILIIGETDKMLNGICNEDLLTELNNFLVDGNSANFRNQICHGLIEPFTIDYYGIYLWWLSLRMVFDTEKLFKFQQ